MTPTEQAQSLIADFFEHQKFPAAPERCAEGRAATEDTPSGHCRPSPIDETSRCEDCGHLIFNHGEEGCDCFCDGSISEACGCQAYTTEDEPFRDDEAHEHRYGR